MPLDWSDLNAPPERWTLITVPQRLKRLKADPWASCWTATQEISDTSFDAIQGY
jgi:DNA primase